MLPQQVLDFIDANRQRYVEELLGFLQIPSISTYSQNTPDVQAAAGWVADRFHRLGFETRVFPTARHPVVFAQRMEAPGRPTLLIYGHYDVQPPEPLEEWTSPPFSPVIRDGYVFARGATDDKGQFFTHLKAIEALLSVEGKLPLNVKIMVEGEEEIGSPSLGAFLTEHKQNLKSDFIAISDGSQFKQGTPAITYGLRGLCYLQLDIQGPRFDLHSGAFGGVVANPIMVLANVLAKLKNADGTVAIPGFYDDVLAPQEWERREMASLPIDEEALKAYLGVQDLPGEPGYTPRERKSLRPTLDANGIWGGFAGEGAKTIIPAKAGAKVSMRLVPNQDPKKITESFRKYVASLVPKGMHLTVTDLHGAKPVLAVRDRPSVQAAARAIETGFGIRPVFIREGGSIPIVNLFQETLEVQDILLLGWGSPDDGAHSPNERFFLNDFHSGIRSSAALLHELASL